MSRSTLSPRCTVIASALVALSGAIPQPASAQAPTRPMTFLDVQEMRRAGSWAPSPDGQWMLYTISTPDWQEAEGEY